jgi:hypothetical protein
VPNKHADNIIHAAPVTAGDAVVKKDGFFIKQEDYAAKTETTSALVAWLI